MNVAAIPAELRERDQWVVWKNERRAGGKWTKVPYRASDGRTKAAVDNPRTWGPFEQAIAVPPATVHGVGYVFSTEDPFTGADFDECVDRATGELHPTAGEALKRLGGYQELSPSSTGMHAIVEAELRGDRNRTGETPWGGNFEVYDRGRFFTVTGDGGGAIVDRQAQVDELVARLLGDNPPTAAAADDDAGPGRPVDELLAAFADVARFLERKGHKPGDGTASAWDYAMCCRAAEHECSDLELAALISEARRRHGETKGERADYVKRTIAAARKKVGYPAQSPAAILERLTKDLHAAQVGLTVVDVRASGNRMAIVFSDGTELTARAEQIAMASRLGAELATTIGIATDLSTLQARRVAALVRRYAGRTNEAREQEQAITWGIEFLQLAETRPFDFTDQRSKFGTWRELDDHDPDDKTSSRSAEAYARKSIVAVDNTTGIRYVRAGWFQEYVRRTGATQQPADVLGLMVDVGWQRKGSKGRIKATDPSGLHDPVRVPFYLVPAGWENAQEVDE